MSSSRQTVPLPPTTLRALVKVYKSRNLSERRLSSAIGTMHPHVGRIMAGKSRPSKILAYRIGWALELPQPFTMLMAEQSSNVGRKMRVDDGFKDTRVVGDTPCPHDLARAYEFMRVAMVTAGKVSEAREFADEFGLWTIGIVPAMGGPEGIAGKALDPWGEFADAYDGFPLVVWKGDGSPPRELSGPAMLEFIASLPRDAVVRCTHHV